MPAATRLAQELNSQLVERLGKERSDHVRGPKKAWFQQQNGAVSPAKIGISHSKMKVNNGYQWFTYLWIITLFIDGL
jgi:hypothetical protein